jgi:nucleoside-diphosphate-sugar epimerase
LRPPWIVSPDELSELRKTHGVRPLQFGMYHYVDVRDVADACRCAITCEVAGFEAMFVGSGETTVAEPLCQLYPRLAPDIGAKAAALTGSRAPVSVEKAKRVLNWAPRHSWRTNAHLAGPSET